MFDALQYAFIQNALVAGSLVAVTAALLGYFVIARGLTFAGHALPNIGFAGAAGAVLLGIDPVFGLFAFTMAASVGIGFLGRDVRERDTAIGVLMTFALGLGLLFLALYSGYAERVYAILFGSILGISQQDVLITALCTILTLALLLVIFRPLLFSTFDPDVAQARGVPVQFLAVFFLLLVAITISLSVQVIGALLVFVLLIGPAATATRITQRPFLALLLSVLLGVSYTWLGILLASSDVHSWLGLVLPTVQGYWPVSFFIASIAFLVYLPVRLLSPLWIGRGTRHARSSLPLTTPVAQRETEQQAFDQRVVKHV